MNKFGCTLCVVLLAPTTLVASTEVFIAPDGADGVPSYYYVSNTGEFGIRGEGQEIGLISAESQSGIFSDRTLPRDPFGSVSTFEFINWIIVPSSGNAIGNARLANLGPGRTPGFLQDDLTLFWSGGIGTPNETADLAWNIPTPTASTLLTLACVGLGMRRSR